LDEIENLRGEDGEGSRRNRQPDRESAPAPYFTLGRHSPVVSLGEILHDGETKPRSAVAVSGAAVRTVETLEHSGKIFWTDSLAGVGDGKVGPPVLSLESDGNCPIGGGVPQRVVKQVRQDLGEPTLIADDLNWLHVLQADIPAFSPRPYLMSHPFDHPIQGERPSLHDLAGLYPGQHEQVSHQTTHPFDLLPCLPNAFQSRLAVGNSIDKLEIRLNGQERVSQLVGGIGNEVAVTLQRLGDSRQQLVDRFREDSDFIGRTGIANPPAEVPLAADGRRLPRDGKQWTQALMGNEPAGEARGGKRSRAEKPEKRPKLGHSLLQGPEGPANLEDADHHSIRGDRDTQDTEGRILPILYGCGKAAPTRESGRNAGVVYGKWAPLQIIRGGHNPLVLAQHLNVGSRANPAREGGKVQLGGHKILSRECGSARAYGQLHL
jgi:hypothetical protein